MPGSVNDNEPFYDSDDNSPESYLEDLDEPDEFAPEQSPLASADPHRTLWPGRPYPTSSPKAQAGSDPIVPAAARKSVLDSVRELRSRNAQAAGSARNTSTQAVSQPDLGPCLYFGPAGQRCDQRAVAGSFCGSHQPKDADRLGETSSVSLPQMSKRALGAAGIIAVLWPILFDLIRALLRFLR
jgi:hypothetical protein